MTTPESAPQTTPRQPATRPRPRARPPHPRAFWWLAGAALLLTAAAVWHDSTEEKKYLSKQVESIAQLRCRPGRELARRPHGAGQLQQHQQGVGGPVATLATTRRQRRARPPAGPHGETACRLRPAQRDHLERRGHARPRHIHVGLQRVAAAAPGPARGNGNRQGDAHPCLPRHYLRQVYVARRGSAADRRRNGHWRRSGDAHRCAGVPAAPAAQLAGAVAQRRQCAGLARWRHADRQHRLVTQSRGELALGKAGNAVDMLGNRVIGAVRAVPGTAWYLVSTVDRSEWVDAAL